MTVSVTGYSTSKLHRSASTNLFVDGAITDYPDFSISDRHSRPRLEDVIPAWHDRLEQHRPSMKVPFKIYLAEMAGTGLLILIGLSIVIVDFGQDSRVVELIPDPGLRRLITGFLFGSTGALIAVSRLGKESGAHINPVVTLGFYLEEKIAAGHAFGYWIAQLSGAILGSLPLLLWGRTGASVDFGATVPGTGYGAWQALLGEVITTFALITGLFYFLGRRRLQPFTPLLFPALYAVMVYLEAPISGTSTNPARSLGPAVISSNWQDWWVYWVGPLVGTVIAVFVHRLPPLNRFEIAVAKIYHHEYDPHKIFHVAKFR
jgi:aquaporin Z